MKAGDKVVCIMNLELLIDIRKKKLDKLNENQMYKE